MRVALLGYFGWGNFGDQLFLDTVRTRSNELFGEGTTIMCLPRRNLAWHARLGAVGSMMRVAYALRAALTADVVVRCGGSVFSDVRGTNAILRKYASGRLQALGVSVGPFASAQKAGEVASFLTRFERVVFRDDSWRLLLGRLEGSWAQGGDLAALSHRIVCRGPREGIVVCPSAASHRGPEILVSQAIQAVRRFQEAGYSDEVTVLALNSHPRIGDKTICKVVEAQLRAKGISVTVRDFGDLGVEGTCDVLASARLVISERLHGAVVAYLAGGRFILVDHHQKCRDFLEDIGAVDEVVVQPDERNLDLALEAALGVAPPYSVAPSMYIERALSVYCGKGRN